VHIFIYVFYPSSMSCVIYKRRYMRFLGVQLGTRTFTLERRIVYDHIIANNFEISCKTETLNKIIEFTLSKIPGHKPDQTVVQVKKRMTSFLIVFARRWKGSHYSRDNFLKRFVCQQSTLITFFLPRKSLFVK